MGVIEADGKFTLNIPYVDRSLPGATEGPHTARLVLPIGNALGHGTISIPGEFTVKPQENQFTIAVPKPPYPDLL